jgi:hypothetical protein
LATDIERSVNEELAWDRVEADRFRAEATARGDELAPFEETEAGKAHATRRATARKDAAELRAVAVKLDTRRGTTLVVGFDTPVALVHDLTEDDEVMVACILGEWGIGIMGEYEEKE